MDDKAYETGTTHFLDRMNLTKRLEDNVESFLDHYGFNAMPYGHPVVIGTSGIGARLRRVESKASLPALQVKFTPDYIVARRGAPDALFFMDAKASITPVFFGAQVERIRKNANKDTLTSADVGEIEREAWFSYNTFYPSDRVALFIAAPYHPRVLLGEWVSNIECMWCLAPRKEGEEVSKPWDCGSCPVKSGGGFGVMVNEFAGGSGTPHTNIDLRSMRTLDQFLADEFALQVDPVDYSVLVDYVKQWPLNKPSRVNWTQYNGLIRRLRPAAPWLKYRIKDKFYDDYPRSVDDGQMRF